MNDRYVYLIASVGTGSIKILYATMDLEKAYEILNHHPNKRFLWTVRLSDNEEDQK